MAIGFDAAVSGHEYSIRGQSIEFGGVPYDGMPEISGGGVTKEGEAYQRGARGQILSKSSGIKTPQDFTTVMAIGTFSVLKSQLDAYAFANGLTGDQPWMDVPITVTRQTASANPLAAPHTETMIVSVMSWQSKTEASGAPSDVTVVWKQHTLPTVGSTPGLGI